MSADQDKARALALEPSSTVDLEDGEWKVRMSWMGSPLGLYDTEAEGWVAAKRVAEARANYARRSASMPAGERARPQASRLAAPPKGD